jgi:hypothetical protein
MHSPPPSSSPLRRRSANNLGAFVLLWIPIANARTAFNWLFTGSIAVTGIGLALFYSEQSRRRAVDEGAVGGGAREFVFGVGNLPVGAPAGGKKKRRRRRQGADGALLGDGETDGGSTLMSDGFGGGEGGGGGGGGADVESAGGAPNPWAPVLGSVN